MSSAVADYLRLDETPGRPQAGGKKPAVITAHASKQKSCTSSMANDEDKCDERKAEKQMRDDLTDDFVERLGHE